jgi:DNA polymerase V
MRDVKKKRGGMAGGVIVRNDISYQSSQQSGWLFPKMQHEIESSLSIHTVSAGHPIPLKKQTEFKLDLNEYLIKRPSATFFARTTGDSMIGAGIHDGDLLIVDRSLDPESGGIVVAAVDGNLTVKRYVKDNDKTYLCPENNEYKRLEITAGSDVYIWGVVTSIIHEV